MIKYAKIINNKTKECDVALGTNIDFYKSIGMTEIEVEQAYNGSWYVKGYAPEKPLPTYNEIENLRVEYRKENIDNKTIERNRRMANGSWTEEDETAYLELDRQVTEYINQHYPYPD